MIASPESRHRIVAAIAERMAATDSLDRQPAAAQGPVTINGFGGILRTAGRKTAMTAEKGAQQELIGTNQELQQLGHLGTLWALRRNSRARKLAVGLKFGYNTAVSFSGELPCFAKCIENRKLAISREMFFQGVA
jgi:hypothetical protein